MYRGRSITAAVRQVIDLDATFQDSIVRGYANLSALARIIKPQVEYIVGSRVNGETITTALKRLRSRYGSYPANVVRVLAESQITVRTDVAKLSLKRTHSSRMITRMMIARHKGRLLQVLEGTSAIVLIHERAVHERVRQGFSRQYLIAEEPDLAAIFMKSPEEITKTPGCVTVILHQLSSRGINVEEILSCHTDTIIIVSREEGGRAFDTLSQLINTCRRLTIHEPTHVQPKNST